MISIELATQLKQCGFPQEVDYGDWIYYPDKNYSFIANSDEMADVTGGYNPALHRESTTAKPDRIKIPTLSELIEACGQEFGGVYQYKYPGTNGMDFVAISQIQTSIQKNKQEEGPTPEEAVAKLWIALSKNKN